jgi:hypothetical protein
MTRQRTGEASPAIARAAAASLPARSLQPVVADALLGPARPLDAATRAFMEPRFGQDFSQVRVRTDAPAAASARAMHARAYTSGRDLVFGDGQYAPHSTQGRRLIAHELTHVVQQHGAPRHGAPTVNRTGDRFEREADAAAQRITAGGSAHVEPASGVPGIQRDGPATDEQKKPAEDPIVDGLKTVAEQAVDNNPKVKTVVIEPLKKYAKGQWDQLSGGQKAGVIGWGAGTLALSGGAMLSDPHGRKTLEGTNLAAPLTLIPYMPLSSFKYTLPSGDSPDQRLFKFQTGFKADELLNVRTERLGLPKMALSVDLAWGYDPVTERLTVLGGDAKLGVVPGLTISGGAYKDILRQPDTTIGEGGQLNQSMKSIPGGPKPDPIPDVRVMVTVDLLKFKPGELKQQIRSLF